MKKRLQQIFSHPLISGSKIVFTGFYIAALFNYFFNLAMVRLLSEQEYGLLVTLSSILILLGGIFQTSFTSSFAKFSAQSLAKNDRLGLSKVVSIGNRIVFLFAGSFFLMLLFFNKPVMSFLRVDNVWILILIYVAIAFSIVSSLPFGIVQGQMRFFLISFFTAFQTIFRLVLGILLVYLGFRVFGAVWSIFFTLSIPTLVLLFLTFKYYHKRKKEIPKETKIFIKEFFRYALPVFLTTVGIAVLTNIDIVLVRHFFTDVESGQYAALSIMGKAIYYITSPLQLVFFPLIAYKKEKKESLSSTLMLAVGIVVLASVALSFLYFTFPHLVIQIFAPSLAYKQLSSYLGLFSLYILGFSLVMLLNNFFLSIGKTGVYKITLFSAVLQIVLMTLFHKSLYQVISVLFFVSLVINFCFLLYYLRIRND